MAHFAQIENDIVTQVLVVPDGEETRGAEYLADDLGLGGEWIQTSYNDRIRRQFAGVGYTYDTENDIFVSPSPFPSWQQVLTSDGDGEAPTPRPADGNWAWDEPNLVWVVDEPPAPE